MKVKIKYDRFRALSLARAGEKELRRSFQGVWLDFAKNRVMTTDGYAMMITLPDYGMIIDAAPTQHTCMNIPAEAVEQILKFTSKKTKYLTIESEDENKAVITDGGIRVHFEFDKSKMPSVEKYIPKNADFESEDKNFFGKAIGGQFIRKAGKVAMILNKRQPHIRFYPSFSEEKHAPVNLIIGDEILMIIMPIDLLRCDYSLDWNNGEQAA